MELALAIDDQKANVYATQNGYLYHHSVNNQQIPNTECKLLSFLLQFLSSFLENVTRTQWSQFDEFFARIFLPHRSLLSCSPM